MPTAVGVVNEALVELGHDTIASLAGTDEVSIACNAVYADTRDAVLLLYAWKFATYQIGLPESTNPPVFKWGHQYPLPDGVKYGGAPYCLRVLTTSEGEGGVWDLGQHTVDGRVLYAHPLALGTAALAQLANANVAIEYTGRVTDLDLWDLLAIRLLVKMLASTLAKALTGQTALAEEKLKEALALLPAAQKEQEEQAVPIGLYPIPDGVTTQLRVMNQALALLKQPLVRSTTEDTAHAKIAAHFVPDAILAVLDMHDWTFATLQLTLALSAVQPSPVHTWAYAFDLPSGGPLYHQAPAFLRMVRTSLGVGGLYELGVYEGTPPTAPGDVAGRVLWTDAPAVDITYIGIQSNLALWTPLAIQVLILLLAARLAPALLPEAGAAFQVGAAFEKQAEALVAGAAQRNSGHGEPQAGYPGIDTLESQLRVANQALALLGLDPIRHLTDDTPRAYQMRLHFTTSMAAVLQMHVWNFAKLQCTLTECPLYIPPLRWLHAYDLPDGIKYAGKPLALKVIGTDQDPGAWWEIGNDGVTPDMLGVSTGKVLLTHQSPCVIEYIGLVTNLGIWSPLAIEALTAMLAAHAAPALVHDAHLGASYRDQAWRWVHEARRQDAKEGTPVRLRPNANLVRRRLSYGGYSESWGDRSVVVRTASVPQVAVPGRTFGMSTLTIAAADAVLGGSRIVIPDALPAQTRVSMVVYQCTASFGTTLGLTAVDIGQPLLQDHWGRGVGITFGTLTDYSDNTGGLLDIVTDGAVWVSAVGGAFDATGTGTLFVLWERADAP